MLCLGEQISLLGRTLRAGSVRIGKLSRRALGCAVLFLYCAGAPGWAAETGELGGELGLLEKFYSAPQSPGESNHYIDMWDGGHVRSLTAYAGLTNNHALFINSHGRGYRGGHGSGYAFYPHQSLDQRSDQLFSIKDLASVVGTAAPQIHNVIVAGCDMDRAFNATALRRYFPNATNITHAVSGEAGYQPMYVQALLSPSQNIEPLYEMATTTPQGQTQYQITATPSARAKKLTPYIAELFKPGARKPFRTQVAGRELIDPSIGVMTLTAATAR